MTLSECYRLLGGSYEAVLLRLPSERSVRKFLQKFTEDTTLRELKECYDRGDLSGEFRAAHTLKGICLNLSLDRLLESSAALTEFLRGASSVDAKAHKRLFTRVLSDYEGTCAVISQLESPSDL